MKKRVFSLLLSIVLLFSLMAPITASATDAEEDHQIKLVLYKDSETFSGKDVLRVDFTYRSNAEDKPNNQMVYLKYDATKLDILDNVGEASNDYLESFSTNISDWAVGNVYKVTGKSGISTEVMLYGLVTDDVGYLCWKNTETGSGVTPLPDYQRFSSIYFELASGVSFDEFPADAFTFCEVTDDTSVMLAQAIVAEIVYNGSTMIHYGSTEVGDPINTLVEPLIVMGSGVTGEKLAYSGTEASTPTVSSNAGGTIVLEEQTVENETVEYTCSETNSAEGATWQDSTTFSDLTCDSTYYFFARVKASDTHKAGTTAGPTSAVAAKGNAVITVNTEPIEKTYGEEIELPTATTNYGEVTETITKGGATVAEIKDVGVYTVTYSVAAGATWNAAADKTVTVTVTKRSVTVTVDEASRKYGEENPTFTAQVTDGSLGYTDAVADLGLGLSSAASAASAVGTYDVVGDGEYNTNYNVTVVGTGKLTVTRADGAVTAPTAKTLTYNGGEQALVNAGSSSTGTIQYKLSGGTYGTDIPKATDAGTYTVYYKVIGDTNHNDVADKSVSVTIEQLDITGASVGAFGEMTYSGSPQTPSAAVTKNSLTATGEWSKVTNISDKTTFTASGNFKGTITDQSTGMKKKTVDALDLTSLITAPVKNAAPQSTFADQTQYTGTISWTGSPSVFLGGTAYTAVVALTATDNYTFTGVAANSFTYTGATVTNAANSGNVTVVFPNTTNASVTSIAIKTPANKLTYKCGETLDVTGLVITATMDDATTEDVNVTAAMVSGFSSSLPAASKVLTITYGGKTTTYNVSVVKADGPAAPDGLAGVDTTNGLNNGKITGTLPSMEYSTNTGFTDAKSCGTSETTGLAAGTYYVRYKETSTHNAGAYATVVVANGPVTITWSAGGGKWSDSTTANKTTQVAYNDTPTAPETPTKAATAQYTYTFSGWTPTIAKATAAVTYTAQYGSTVNKYTVEWKNYDGTVLETDTNVPYGTTPSYDGATPTKPSSGSATYTFIGWAPAIGPVTGNTVYTAQFSENSGYTVIWKDYDGRILETDTNVVYGTMPSYNGRTPTRAEDAYFTYRFAGWTPTVTAVTGNAVYTAVYNASLKPHGDDTDYVRITSSASDGGTITPSGSQTVKPGSSITFKMKANDGCTLEAVYVDGKNVGAVSEYTFRNVREAHTICASFNDPNGGSYKICPRDATCPIEPFTDTVNDAWWHDGIHYCVEHKLMQGISNTSFNPTGTTTRAMIVTILWRLEGEPVANYAMSFKDVSSGEWYTEAVRWAQSTGVVEGYSAEAFGPDDPITREQMATILYRYAKYHGINVANTNALNGYSDKAQVSSWALDAMKWANGAGLVQGRTVTTLVPGASITRAEAAAMIQRYCEKVK